MKNLTAKQKKVVKKFGEVSLYNSLHQVGDDPIKSAIEADLVELLDAKTLKIVRAVFGFHTDQSF